MGKNNKNGSMSYLDKMAHREAVMKEGVRAFTIQWVMDMVCIQLGREGKTPDEILSTVNGIKAVMHEYAVETLSEISETKTRTKSEKVAPDVTYSHIEAELKEYTQQYYAKRGDRYGFE